MKIQNSCIWGFSKPRAVHQQSLYSPYTMAGYAFFKFNFGPVRLGGSYNERTFKLKSELSDTAES